MLFLLVIKNLLRGVVDHTYLSIDPLKEPANTRYSEQFCVISRKGAWTYTCFIKGYGLEAVVSRLVWGPSKRKVFFNLRCLVRVLPPSPHAFPSNSHPAWLMRFQKKMKHFFLSTSGQKYATIGPAPRLAQVDRERAPKLVRRPFPLTSKNWKRTLRKSNLLPEKSLFFFPVDPYFQQL